MYKKILITGGTGLIGSDLKKKVLKKGFDVRVLSRQRLSETDGFFWDPEKSFIDDKAIDFADVIVHLAGENISTKKWTKKQKKRIIQSRLKSTELLKNAIKKSIKKPEKFISASAIGFYGTFTSEKVFSETDEGGNDFLAETVQMWERSVAEITEFGIETVIFRIGVVMSSKGGALPKMIKPVALAPLGNGKQYVSWIALKDLTNLILFSVENKEITGIYNAVNPNCYTNRQIMRDLSELLRKPFIPIGVPAFLLRLIYGEMSALLLNGSRISAEKILTAGFEFKVNKLSDLNIK